MPAPGTIVHLRFEEATSDIPPSDAVGVVADLLPASGDVAPAVVPALTGFGRTFANGVSAEAKDASAAATSLATRDVTIDMLVRWNFDAQNALAPVGTVITRGTGGSASEYVAYSIELRVVNAANRVGEIRFAWQDIAGAWSAQVGGQFVMPPASLASGWVMLTATRHWVSPSDVRCQYYAGGVMLSDVASPNGSIGGGVSGTLRVGRNATGAAGSYFAGDIDEIRVRNYHVSGEEVMATWDRISKWQPAGYTAIRGLLPPGAPVSDLPTSRIQRLLRGIGNAIGFAQAQVDNLQQNMLPDRAFGSTLARWERITGEPARATDAVAQRRDRVMSHMRQHQGVSLPGIRAAETQLLQLEPSLIQVIGATNDIGDDFSSAAIDTTKWQVFPGTGNNASTWSQTGGVLQVVTPSNKTIFSGSIENIPACMTAVDGAGRAAHVVATLKSVSGLVLTSDNEAGVFFLDWANGNLIMFGVRNNNATSQLELWCARYVGWGSVDYFRVGTDVLAGPQINLHLSQDDPGASATTAIYRFETAATRAGPYKAQGTVAHPAGFGWAGVYVRAITTSRQAATIQFDDFLSRSSFGRRPFYWTIYRDPALPGTPDINSARATAQRLAQAHTKVGVSQAPKLLFDDPLGLYDQTPLGGQ